MADDGKDIRDEIADQCVQAADLLARLEHLVTEPRAPYGGPARPGRPAIIPEPYGHPGRVLMTTHEGVRRLEASLRFAVTGQPGRRRGGSDRNTADALDQIAKLSTQLDDRRARLAARYLRYLIGGAQSIDAIDEATRWRHLPKKAGDRLPPNCPYCGVYALLADMDSLIVVCSNPGCPGDANGDGAVAAMTWDEDDAVLAWADGRIDRVTAVAGFSPPPAGNTGQ